MSKILFVFLAVLILSSPASCRAVSEGAMALRAQNALWEFTPPESFLGSYFVADEIEPQYVFAKVEDFVKARSCTTTWLIDEGEKNRIKEKDNRSGPLEYTLYLEEDCPGRIIYFIFIDRSQSQSAMWMEWRKQFHKSKAEPQYGAVSAALDRAASMGYPVGSELRFIEIGGELMLKKVEDALIGDLKTRPVYDLKKEQQ